MIALALSRVGASRCCVSGLDVMIQRIVRPAIRPRGGVVYSPLFQSGSSRMDLLTISRIMRFRPAIQQGNKVRQWVEQTFHFRIVPPDTTRPVGGYG